MWSQDGYVRDTVQLQFLQEKAAASRRGRQLAAIRKAFPTPVAADWTVPKFEMKSGELTVWRAPHGGTWTPVLKGLSLISANKYASFLMAHRPDVEVDALTTYQARMNPPAVTP